MSGRHRTEAGLYGLRHRDRVKAIAVAVGAPVSAIRILHAQYPDRLHHHAAGAAGQCPQG